jgi:hypothetical protein
MVRYGTAATAIFNADMQALQLVHQRIAAVDVMHSVKPVDCNHLTFLVVLLLSWLTGCNNLKQPQPLPALTFVILLQQEVLPSFVGTGKVGCHVAAPGGSSSSNSRHEPSQASMAIAVPA